MNMVVFRRCQSALGVAAVMALALVASLVFAAMPAAAVTLSRADAGTFLRYEHGGEQVIGVMAKDSTNTITASRLTNASNTSWGRASSCATTTPRAGSAG